MCEFLKKDGLSIAILRQLTYHSTLGISLKKNLHYFDKEQLFEELISIIKWYDVHPLLRNLNIDYRIKSPQSAFLKYYRYYPDHQARKVFNDLLGFRTLVDDYQELLALNNYNNFKVVDLSHGKAKDDGYRGVHIYYQENNICYPIEIQYNTYFDRQCNDWLHKYVYKREYQDSIGDALRSAYEKKLVRTENEFTEVLQYVLSCSKKDE